MKKSLPILALLVFLVFASRVRAQEFNFAKAYQDYIYTQTVYDQAYREYEDSRDFYLKNKTLTLKEEARKKTLAMLKERDELFRVYFAALRMKLMETKVAVPPNLDAEIAWFASHKDTYKDSDPLEDLFGKSKESEARYKTSTSPVIYDSLFNTSLGEISALRTRHEEVFKSVREILDKNVAEGKLKIDPFGRWLTDIEGVVSQLKTNEDKAKQRMAKMFSESYAEPKSAFNSSIKILEPSTGLLTQLNSFITELLTSIQSQL